MRIVLDCDPFSPRPGDLISEVVKGTILEGLPAAQPDATVSRIFGMWTWDFSEVTTSEEWTEVKRVIGPRIQQLYHEGRIRYGEWG